MGPLFTAERDGRRLRAFAAEGSAPALPWLALGDLAAALTTERDDEVELLAGLGAGPFGLPLRTVTTAEGSVVLVDQPSAFLLLQFVGVLEDGPDTLAETTALLEDAIVGGLAAALAHLTSAEAASHRRLAWERSRLDVEACIGRYRRDAGAAEQRHG